MRLRGLDNSGYASPRLKVSFTILLDLKWNVRVQRITDQLTTDTRTQKSIRENVCHAFKILNKYFLGVIIRLWCSRSWALEPWKIFNLDPFRWLRGTLFNIHLYSWGFDISLSIKLHDYDLQDVWHHIFVASFEFPRAKLRRLGDKCHPHDIPLFAHLYDMGRNSQPSLTSSSYLSLMTSTTTILIRILTR